MDEKNITTAIPEEENDLVLRFAKPYTFEEETVAEVDLSGLENITAADLIAAKKQMNKGGGSVEMIPEMTLEHATIIAARITGKPIEFFTRLPAREAIKLKNIVSGFIFGAD